MLLFCLFFFSLFLLLFFLFFFFCFFFFFLDKMFSKKQVSNQEQDTKSSLLEKPDVDDQERVDIVVETTDHNKLYYTLTKNPPIPLTVAVAFQVTV